jgi:hypothetical protein
MRAAVVVADILAQDALGVALAEDEDVIEAVATKCPDQTLANSVRQRRSRRRAKASHPETTKPSTERRVVNAVAVEQQEARWRVADCLDHALRDPRARRVRGHPNVDNPAALERDNNERVERLEMHGDHREEVAGPNLRGVVPEKGRPALSAAAGQVLWAILADRARRYTPAELRELAGNPVLAPQPVLSPHAPDEVA